jgi:hypothetical protein
MVMMVVMMMMLQPTNILIKDTHHHLPTSSLTSIPLVLFYLFASMRLPTNTISYYHSDDLELNGIRSSISMGCALSSSYWFLGFVDLVEFYEDGLW